MSTPLPLTELIAKAQTPTPADASMERHAHDNWGRRAAIDKMRERCSPATMAAVMEVVETAYNKAAEGSQFEAKCLRVMNLLNGQETTL